MVFPWRKVGTSTISRMFLITILMFGGTVCNAGTLGKKCSYREVGDMYMRSFGLDSETESPTKQDEDDSKFQPLQLTTNEKRSLTFNLLARHEEKQAQQSDKLLKTALADLEFFYAPGRNYDSTLFAHLNHTRTVFGEAVLGKILANPTVDQELLSMRQEFIKELIDNESLFNELDAIISQVHDAEENILSFWKEETDVTKKAIKSLYFGKKLLKNLNSNSIALEAKVRMRNMLTALQVSAEFFSFVGMNYLPPKVTIMTLNYLNSDLVNQMPPAPTLWESTKGACSMIWNFYNPKKWFYRFTHPYRELVGNEIAAQEEMHSYNELDPEYLESIREGTATQNKWSSLFWIAGFTAVGAYSAFQFYNKKRIISSEVQANNLQMYLQSRLIDMACLVGSVKQLQSISSNHVVMDKVLSSLEENTVLFSDNKICGSAAAKKLVKLLLSSTFKGNASVFSLTGRVLSAYQLMASAKDELIGLMETIGELDAYLSIAKLYKKHASLPARYCFAHYVLSDKPYMNAQGFWNPVLDPRKAVRNDLVLGGDCPERNGIVTGSNTGGKSTSLKALGINTWLAQTIGLVPAESYTVAPFEVISTSLNIKDDTEGGQSLFKAEVLRAQKLIDAAKKLSQGSFAFYVIDELFTGTAPEKGQEAAYQVATTLCNTGKVIFLWATHYPRLTQLEEDTKGACKNYKMEAYVDVQTGALIRPFKLEEGISTSNIALEILESELQEGAAFLA